MGQKVLVIDDEQEMVELIADSLYKRDYEVLTAYKGSEGVEKAAEEVPDIILLDIMMPDMDGFESLRRIKRDPATRGIPVIMISAVADTHSIFIAEELGSDDYLVKPIKMEDLIALVARYTASADAGFVR